LVCHITDGEFSGADPEPCIRRIMSMSNSDGKVLVENIFISDDILPQPIISPNDWPGIGPQTQLLSQYASKMRSFSSPLPASYRSVMAERGYAISTDAVMMLPGNSAELVEMAFAMSMSTPISSAQH
jgi:hypothetical protein